MATERNARQVADRMDITGARWSIDGAEAILKLRAVRANDDFDDYWPFHLDWERQRVHESRYNEGPHHSPRSHSSGAAPINAPRRITFAT